MFSKNLMIALANRNLTESAAAAKIGVTEREFKLYTDGVVEPDAPTLRKIADVCNVTIKELGGDNDLSFTSFGEELKALRERQNLTVADEAKLLGVTCNLVKDIEGGITARPQNKTLEKYGDLFGEEFYEIKRKYFPTGVPKHSNNGEVLATKPGTPMETAKAEALKSAINSLMEKKKISTNEFAKRVGVSHKTFEKIKINGYLPVPKLYEKIVEVLGYEPIAVRKNIPYQKPALEVQKPVVEVQKPKAVATGFKREWADLLSYIDSDSEYRKATEALFKLAFDGSEITQIDGCPQANLILKMVVK